MRRYWASRYGYNACISHGMRDTDTFLTRRTRLEGIRNGTIEVVGDWPEEREFHENLRYLDYRARYHNPDWARHAGVCSACLEIQREDQS